jgi:hypothetical protein
MELWAVERGEAEGGEQGAFLGEEVGAADGLEAGGVLGEGAGGLDGDHVALEEGGRGGCVGGVDGVAELGELVGGQMT